MRCDADGGSVQRQVGGRLASRGEPAGCLPPPRGAHHLRGVGRLLQPAQGRRGGYAAQRANKSACAVVHRLTTARFMPDRTSCTAEVAWNNNAIELVRASKAHCYYILLFNFVEAVKSLPAGPVGDVLKNLCDLFALSHIERFLGDFVEDGCAVALGPLRVLSIAKSLTMLCMFSRKPAPSQLPEPPPGDGSTPAGAGPPGCDSTERSCASGCVELPRLRA